MLVRHGKGGRRREIGMDDWGWRQLEPWLKCRLQMPVCALFCVINGPAAGRPWSSAAARTQFRRLASQTGVRRRFAPHQLRHAHAVEMAREGVPLNVIQRQLGDTRASGSPRSTCRDRQRRDRPRQTRPRDSRGCCARSVGGLPNIALAARLHAETREQALPDSDRATGCSGGIRLTRSISPPGRVGQRSRRGQITTGIGGRPTCSSMDVRRQSSQVL